MFFTEKQLRIMQYIQEYRSAKGISPTMEEIAHRVGVTKITVYDHLNQLEKKGALKRARFRARSIEPLVWVGHEKGQFVLPILGKIQAGEPLQDGSGDETLDLKKLFPSNPDCFVLRVSGDSFEGDLIGDGDYVIVERRTAAKNGDLVFAILNGTRPTIARYYKERSRIRLQTSRTGKKAIHVPQREIEIRGVVVRLLRNLAPPERN